MINKNIITNSCLFIVILAVKKQRLDRDSNLYISKDDSVIETLQVLQDNLRCHENTSCKLDKMLFQPPPNTPMGRAAVLKDQNASCQFEFRSRTFPYFLP
jgi:hypothetical protein